MSRSMRKAHPSAVALFRFVAFVVAAVSVILIVTEVTAAAVGRVNPRDASALALAALATAVLVTVAVRRFDPLRP